MVKKKTYEKYRGVNESSIVMVESKHLRFRKSIRTTPYVTYTMGTVKYYVNVGTLLQSHVHLIDVRMKYCPKRYLNKVSPHVIVIKRAGLV